MWLLCYYSRISIFDPTKVCFIEDVKQKINAETSLDFLVDKFLFGFVNTRRLGPQNYNHKFVYLTNYFKKWVSKTFLRIVVFKY